MYKTTIAVMYIFNSEIRNRLFSSLFLISKIKLNIDNAPKKAIAFILITKFRPKNNPIRNSLGILPNNLFLFSK